MVIIDHLAIIEHTNRKAAYLHICSCVELKSGWEKKHNYKWVMLRHVLFLIYLCLL